MRRPVSVKAAIGVVTLVALVGMALPSRSAHAQSGGALVAGKPRIATIRALVPREGRDAGRLIVWVRVVHASGTSRALARERPETVHSGRVVVRVGNARRVASQRVVLDRKRRHHGYHFRFPRSATRAMVAGMGRRIGVSVRVAQTVDLDSDGDSEDQAVASTARSVPLASPATAIVPDDGWYVNGTTTEDRLLVEQGAVVQYNFPSAVEPVCPGLLGLGEAVHAPIDPQTGDFSFLDSGIIVVTANGSFAQGNPDYAASVDATVVIPGVCDYTVPGGFAFCPSGNAGCYFPSYRVVGHRAKGGRDGTTRRATPASPGA
jgi:hypothetical protein